jgi:hypothetical protein
MSSERKRKGKETAADPKAPVPEKVTAVLDYGKKRPLCAPLQQKFGVSYLFSHCIFLKSEHASLFFGRSAARNAQILQEPCP